MAEVTKLVDVWWGAVADFLALVESLPDEAWHAPTDLPGWDVAAVVSHVAHLEAILAGAAHDEVTGIEIGTPPHVTGLMDVFTEQGVVGRRGRSRESLLEEIRTSTSARHAELVAVSPDPAAPAPGVFGLIGWSNATLLKNRPLDIWMHEQDIRRAAGLPGGLRSPASEHVIGTVLLPSTGFVFGKKVGAPVGASARLVVDDFEPITVAVGPDGRAGRADVEDPTVTITLEREAYVVLAGGRRTPEAVTATVTGDADLGGRLLAALAVTP